MTNRLKLRARDPHDLETIASIVQDALVPLAEMTYLPAEHRFALMLNRFRWEALPRDGAGAPAPAEDGEDARFSDGVAPFERVHAALVFDRVVAVKRRGLEAAAKGGVLSLLTLSCDGPHVLIAFAGGAAVRLETDQLSCHLEDIGEPWPTAWLPAHADSGTPGGAR
jgi:hypothetical protein